MSGPKSVSFTVPLAIAAAPVALAAGAAAQVAMVAQEAARQRRARAAALEARVEELRARAAGLSRKLSTIAGQWQAARDRHGAEFPAWPHGDAASPELIASLGQSGGSRTLHSRPHPPRDAGADRLRHAVDDVQNADVAAVGRRRLGAHGGARSGTLRGRGVAPDRRVGGGGVERGPRRDRETGAGSGRSASGFPPEGAARTTSRRHPAGQRGGPGAAAHGRAGRRLARTAGGARGDRGRRTGRALRRVLAGEEPLPRDMEQRVDDAVARANAPATRDYALGVVREELENLGYVVEAGFRTASPEAPEMLLSKPGLGDGYHVSLRAASGAAKLDARVVREAGGLDAEGPVGPRPRAGWTARLSAPGAAISPRPWPPLRAGGCAPGSWSARRPARRRCGRLRRCGAGVQARRRRASASGPAN